MAVPVRKHSWHNPKLNLALRNYELTHTPAHLVRGRETFQGQDIIFQLVAEPDRPVAIVYSLCLRRMTILRVHRRGNRDDANAIAFPQPHVAKIRISKRTARFCDMWNAPGRRRCKKPGLRIRRIALARARKGAKFNAEDLVVNCTLAARDLQDFRLPFSRRG